MHSSCVFVCEFEKLRPFLDGNELDWMHQVQDRTKIRFSYKNFMESSLETNSKMTIEETGNWPNLFILYINYDFQ